jgi:lysophospholipid acyltransferase (LPLAT)-like uncharacterized protein
MRINRSVATLLAERLGPLMIKTMGVTLRTKRRGLENLARARQIKGNVIYAFWHGRLLPLSYLHRNQGVNVLVSTHQDGEYITRVIHGLGFETSRGSSTRGGTAALRDLMATASRGTDLAITPDGPRGPREQCQPGLAFLARKLGLPVVPVGICFRPSLRLKSWDRFMIPLPFAGGIEIFGEPIIYETTKVSEDILKQDIKDLEMRLRSVTEEAEIACGYRTA